MFCFVYFFSCSLRSFTLLVLLSVSLCWFCRKHAIYNIYTLNALVFLLKTNPSTVRVVKQIWASLKSAFPELLLLGKHFCILGKFNVILLDEINEISTKRFPFFVQILHSTLKMFAIVCILIRTPFTFIWILILLKKNQSVNPINKILIHVSMMSVSSYEINEKSENSCQILWNHQPSTKENQTWVWNVEKWMYTSVSHVYEVQYSRTLQIERNI